MPSPTSSMLLMMNKAPVRVFVPFYVPLPRFWGRGFLLAYARLNEKTMLTLRQKCCRL